MNGFQLTERREQGGGGNGDRESNANVRCPGCVTIVVYMDGMCGQLLFMPILVPLLYFLLLNPIKFFAAY